MGGFGSGRRSNRWTTDDCLRINLSNLKQLGKLQRHCMARREQVWSQYGETIADLTLVTDVHCLEPSPCLRVTGRAFGKVIDCVLYLEEQPLPYGGERWFALCPRTGRRCTALVLPPGQTHFASVKGWNVPYGSQLALSYSTLDTAQKRLHGLFKFIRKPAWKNDPWISASSARCLLRSKSMSLRNCCFEAGLVAVHSF